MQERDQKILDLFKKNNVWYEYGWTADGNLEVDVSNGDWKHDHIFLEYFMRNAGYEQVEVRRYGPPTGGDWYSAVHVFKAPAAVPAGTTVP